MIVLTLFSKDTRCKISLLSLSLFLSFKEQKERTSQRITLDLHSVGLSLVNDEKSIEVSYIGIRP